jgi:hypothetical protein
MNRLHHVIINELKKNKVVTVHRGKVTVDQLIKQLEDTGPDEYVTDSKREASIRLNVLHVF